jgi:cytochrome c peroxidase
MALQYRSDISVIKLLFVLGVLLPLLSSCESSETEYQDMPLAVSRPSNFPQVAYDVTLNPPTQKGFELGRKLFYDGRLSEDGLVSCAFCHIQEDAFTHHGHTVSHGVNNMVGMRNAPAIQNMAFQSVFMWDGASSHLDLQPLIPLTSPLEMGGNLDKILAMMKGDPVYRKLFAQAFPGKDITTENMLKALSQFMVMMVSDDSRFDKFRRNEPGGILTEDEQEGYTVFNQKCATCHATDLMTDDSFRNNGLAVNAQVNDVGRYKVTELAGDYYKFRVPSLRNVALTAPYMHDGRFGSLESVLNHYSSGVTDSATLDPLLKNGGTLGIPLTEHEKTVIIAFLNTLTDEEFITNPLFSYHN